MVSNSSSLLPTIASDWVLRHMRLVGTDGCHLCQAALATIEAAIGHIPPEWDIVDFPEPLYRHLEVRIPVLYIDTSVIISRQIMYQFTELPDANCLAWPFTEAEVSAWMRSFYLS